MRSASSRSLPTASLWLLPSFHQVVVALRRRHSIQHRNAQSRLQIRLTFRQRLLQFAHYLPRRPVALVHKPLFPLRIHPPFPLPARPVKVQVPIQVPLVEPVDLLRVPCRDVPIPHVLPDHRSVFRLHQPVVVALSRPRCGLLFPTYRRSKPRVRLPCSRYCCCRSVRLIHLYISARSLPAKRTSWVASINARICSRLNFSASCILTITPQHAVNLPFRPILCWKPVFLQAHPVLDQTKTCIGPQIVG